MGEIKTQALVAMVTNFPWQPNFHKKVLLTKSPLLNLFTISYKMKSYSQKKLMRKHLSNQLSEPERGAQIPPNICSSLLGISFILLYKCIINIGM